MEVCTFVLGFYVEKCEPFCFLLSSTHCSCFVICEHFLRPFLSPRQELWNKVERIDRKGHQTFLTKRDTCQKHKAFSMSSFCWPLQLFWFILSWHQQLFLPLWINIRFILILNSHRLANSDHTEDQITACGTMAFVWVLIRELVNGPRVSLCCIF